MSVPNTAHDQNMGSQQTRALWTRDFWLIFLVNLTVFVAFQMLMPTMPLYIKHLGGQESIVGIITGIFTISAVAARLWTGLQLDLHGRKGIFLVGLGTFTLVVVGYSLVPSIALLALLRIVHGFGWAASTTAAGTVAADIIPPERRGEGMGYYGMSTNLAMALAPALGLAVLNWLGFASLFYLSAGIAFLAFVLAMRIHYLPVEAKTSRSSLLEKHAFTPSAIVFCVALAYGGMVTFLPLYATQQGISNIGPFFTVYAVLLMAVRPVAGMLHDRRGPAIVVTPGLIFVIGAMLVLTRAANLWIFLAAAALMGAGFGLVQPSLQAMTVSGVPPSRRGAANGTFLSALDLGIGLGAMLLGIIADRYNYQAVYLVSAALAAVGLFVFIILRPKKTEI